MESKCKVCGGSGKRLQPVPMGRTMGVILILCSKCKGTGRGDDAQ